MNTNDSISTKTNRAKKMMLWFGMISMSMTFAGLTSAYVVSSSRADWIQQIELPFAFTLSTLLIVLSSGSFYGALRMLRGNKIKETQLLLLVTLGLALAFVYFQFQGFNGKRILFYRSRKQYNHFLFIRFGIVAFSPSHGGHCDRFEYSV
jgi:cytochrome c oxidase subunit 3